jgi:hypothetical protein
MRISGKNGKLMIGSSQLHIKGWDADDTVDTPESTDSESAGVKRRIVGHSDFNGNFTGFWDDTSTPMAQGFTPGTEGTIKLYTDATHFYQAAVIINSLSPSVDVHGGGPVEFKGSFVGNGPVTRPA